MSMTTERQRLMTLVRDHADLEFQSEVRHYVNDIGDREYAYDEVSALFDIEMSAQEPGGDKRLLKIARTMLIEVGYYRAMSAEEIANTYVSPGISKWQFKLHGLAYRTDETTEEWQFPDDMGENLTE